MSIEALIQAAEYLDRRERGKREAEHGYASTMPMPDMLSKRRIKSKKSQGNRSTHNELEKNRRAHLRHCMERLKEIVPLGGDASRHTTLGLLTKAKAFIKILEEKDRKQMIQKENLCRERRRLHRRMEQLTNGQYRVRVERSISECSTSASSTASTSESEKSWGEPCRSPTNSTSESDEVDILGYNSNHSDTDDHSSIGSIGSDGGCVLDTRRLTLGESSL